MGTQPLRLRPLTNDVPLTIGARFLGLPVIQHFNGSIDEVEIYNRALSAEEIQAIFLAGSAGGCKVEPAMFLVIDEDSIDNGNPPNFFSDFEVNADIADIGLRTQLPFFAANVGATITLHTGQVGDEGWSALKTVPGSWADAGPTNDGLVNYVLAGPGFGSPDANGDREALLDKIPDVMPLRANLGTVAFEVISVTELTGFFGDEASFRGNTSGIASAPSNASGAISLGCTGF